MTVGVNILPVIVGAVLLYLLGWFWYSPNVFGKLWCSSQNVECDAEKKPPLQKMIAHFVLCLVMTYVLACFIVQLNIDSVAKAVSFGFWIWLGFIATVMYGGVIWGKKSVQAYFIDAGYYLAGLVILSALLSLWLW